jgi:magnesium transporter
MITVYRNVRGVVKQGSVEDIHPMHKLLWVNCVDLNSKELDLLEKKTKIPRAQLTEALDEDEIPRVSTYDHAAKIIFKSSFQEDHSGRTASFGILFNKDYVVTVSHNPISAIENLEKDLNKEEKGRVFIESSDLFVYEILKRVLREFNKRLDTVEEQIDDIEDRLLKKPKHNVVQQIFNIKKVLIYFHKGLGANKEVIATLDRGQIPQIQKKNLPWFRELYYDVNQLIDMEATYRDVVTGTLDLYTSSLSNSINDTMKKLTVVASFILIPTLISGIYGMNFTHMPEIPWKWGYPFALVLMLFSILMMFLYFKAKDWL